MTKGLERWLCRQKHLPSKPDDWKDGSTHEITCHLSLVTYLSLDPRTVVEEEDQLLTSTYATDTRIINENVVTLILITFYLSQHMQVYLPYDEYKLVLLYYILYIFLYFLQDLPCIFIPSVHLFRLSIIQAFKGNFWMPYWLAQV